MSLLKCHLWLRLHYEYINCNVQKNVTPAKQNKKRPRLQEAAQEEPSPSYAPGAYWRGGGKGSVAGLMTASKISCWVVVGVFEMIYIYSWNFFTLFDVVYKIKCSSAQTFSWKVILFVFQNTTTQKLYEKYFFCILIRNVLLTKLGESFFNFLFVCISKMQKNIYKNFFFFSNKTQSL